MHTRLFSATTIGVDAHVIEVEVDLAPGLINFFIVGLPDTAVKESTKRITSALKNCGLRMPSKRITVNLAPATLKKEGTLFDVAIAIGILQASGHVAMTPEFINQTLIAGELSLDGAIRPIKGALALAHDAHRLGKKRLILPQANAHEAALIKDIEVIAVDHLVPLVSFLRNELTISPTQAQPWQESAASISSIDFSQVHGQHQAKRALQIAAAGRHPLLLVGPPGAGKTMLAQRLPTIMPPLSCAAMLETTKIYSIAGALKGPMVSQRPFRNPHHTTSQAGLVGGGSYPQPGEISLAHHGILFLDELPEFKRHVLEVLRQPLQEGEIHIARANQSVRFPASFLLVAALNPCPCGYLGDKKRACSCSAQQLRRYLDKLSGPLLDRIDVQVHVAALDYASVMNTSSATSSAQLYQAVARAVKTQQDRFGNDTTVNGAMSTQQIEQYCHLDHASKTLLQMAFDRMGLSMRAYHKILKVARTIADLEGHEVIQTTHIQEAIMYRSLDLFINQQRL